LPKIVAVERDDPINVLQFVRMLMGICKNNTSKNSKNYECSVITYAAPIANVNDIAHSEYVSPICPVAPGMDFTKSGK